MFFCVKQVAYLQIYFMVARLISRFRLRNTLISIANTKKMSSQSLIEKVRLHPTDFTKANANKDEVFYHLFDGKTKDSKNLNEGTIQAYNFDKNLPTKVFIHGWNSSVHKGNWYDGFKDAYFQRGEYNIVYVDWFIPGSRDFPISAANVMPVGHFVGDFILASKIPLENVHIIAKSLGSHVAGFAGKRIFDLTAKKVARITGLDPAGPKFEHPEIDENQRLSKSDADLVDIVHTDAGYYGFVKPIGTVDFYPNGGGSQPGCTTDDNGHDQSHGRSNWYYLESINSKNFFARKAESWQEYLAGNFQGEEIIFGEDIPRDAQGTYYFETNSAYPYAKL